MYRFDCKMALISLLQCSVNLTVWKGFRSVYAQTFSVFGEIWDVLMPTVIKMLFNIFITVGVNEVYSIKANALCCIFRLTWVIDLLIPQNAPQMCAVWFFFFSTCYKIVVLFAVVLEIVTQGVCLYMTTPRATSRKTAPFYITRIRHSDIFLSISFMNLWGTLRPIVRCLRRVWFLPQSFTKSLSKAELSSLLI